MERYGPLTILPAIGPIIVFIHTVKAIAIRHKNLEL